MNKRKTRLLTAMYVSFITTVIIFVVLAIIALSVLHTEWLPTDTDRYSFIFFFILLIISAKCMLCSYRNYINTVRIIRIKNKLKRNKCSFALIESDYNELVEMCEDDLFYRTFDYFKEEN